MNRKAYTSPCVRPLAMDASGTLLEGSMWTEWQLSRKMELEEDDREEAASEKNDFWSF